MSLLYSNNLSIKYNNLSVLTNDNKILEISNALEKDNIVNLDISDDFKFKVKNIQYSPYGSQIMLLSEKEVGYINIPSINENSEDNYIIKKLVLNNKNVNIIKAIWYPYSDNIIVILTEDLYLSFYNVRLNNDKIIFSINLNEYKPKINSFCYGSNNLWDKFTIYLFHENGTISYLCPVFPPGYELSYKCLKELKEKSVDDYVVTCAILRWQKTTVSLREYYLYI